MEALFNGINSVLHWPPPLPVCSVAAFWGTNVIAMETMIDSLSRSKFEASATSHTLRQLLICPTENFLIRKIRLIRGLSPLLPEV